MIYRGIMGAKPSNQNMEEFLIGIRKKEKISFKAEKSQLELLNVTSTLKETIELKKDNGIIHCPFDLVSVDGLFGAVQNVQHRSRQKGNLNNFLSDF